jgi:hypothetical protein
MCGGELCCDATVDGPQSSLVVGTEASELLIMDTTGTAIQSRVKLPAVPAFLAVNGLLDVDYRVAVAARNGYVYTVKNGELSRYLSIPIIFSATFLPPVLVKGSEAVHSGLWKAR